MGRAVRGSVRDGYVLLIVENSVAHELHRVCLGVVERLELCGATITVMTDEGADAVAAASSVEMRTLADLQFTLGEGPSTDAFRTSRPVLVPDLTVSDGRWIAFTPAVLGLGVTGVYAFPLGLGAIRLGVLTCFVDRRRVLDQVQLSQCLTVADAATELLLSGITGDDPLAPDHDVLGGLHIRSEVYQAQGMLAVELGVSLADALARLRAIAYAEEIDINTLASDLVAGRREFPRRDEGA